MKRFLRYIVLLCVLVLFCMYFLDALYTYKYNYGKPRNKASYIMQHSEDEIDYIFIGSSRVENTINADIISTITNKSTINLGFQGASIDDYYIILKLLQERGIKFEKVFIQIDYVYNLTGNSEILKSYLMPYIGDDFVYQIIKERDSEHFLLKSLPFYRYLKYDYKIGFREFFNLAIGRKPKYDLENGYFPLYGSSGKELKYSLPLMIKKENESINKINLFAEMNNIEIIYFMAPNCPNTTNQNFSKKLREKLPNFSDYSRLFPYQNEYFYDCGHLNDKGATKFSELVAKEIKETLN